MKMVRTFSIVQGKEVVDWVVEGAGTLLGAEAVAIGLLRNGELVAGTAYDNWTGNNIFCHQRVTGRPNSAYWEAVAEYPFKTLGCIRVTSTIDESNLKSSRLVQSIGFIEEGRLKRAAHDGSDVVLWVLWKENCKMLNWKVRK